MAEREQGPGGETLRAVTQQIALLREQGVTFERCDEAEAARYLSERCNYFKVASYCVLFAKRVGGMRDGEYIGLDFAQLRLLASLDQQLRHIVLAMTLDIEHFQKLAILRQAEERGEDGYAIVAEYMDSLSRANRAYRLRELERSGRSPYGADLYAKHANAMPIWAFLELISFGTLIDFIRFCSNRWGDGNLRAVHYDLRRVKSVRNCAAHGSCIANHFADEHPASRPASRYVSSVVQSVGISRRVRRKWLKNCAVQELATTVVLYARMIPEGSTRNRAAHELGAFFERANKEPDLLPAAGPNAITRSALDFLKGLTDSLGLLK